MNFEIAHLAGARSSAWQWRHVLHITHSWRRVSLSALRRPPAVRGGRPRTDASGPQLLEGFSNRVQYWTLDWRQQGIREVAYSRCYCAVRLSSRTSGGGGRGDEPAFTECERKAMNAGWRLYCISPALFSAMGYDVDAERALASSMGNVVSAARRVRHRHHSPWH